ACEGRARGIVGALMTTPRKPASIPSGGLRRWRPIMRTHPHRPEGVIQRALVQHYPQRAAPRGFFFAVPNGGFCRPVQAAIMKATGTVAGVPDTIWIKGGQVFGLEVKADGGRPTQAQLATIAAMEAAGAYCCIAEGLDRALACLEAWGLLRGRVSFPRASRSGTLRNTSSGTPYCSPIETAIAEGDVP